MAQTGETSSPAAAGADASSPGSKAKSQPKQKSMIAIAMDNNAAYKRKQPLDLANEESVTDKIVIITGANAGLGATTALEMAKRGAVVGMCCRDIEKAKKVVADIKAKVANAKLELFALDLGSLESVRKCAEEIKSKFPHVNILINNAGVMIHEPRLQKTKDGFEVNMGINHLGHFLWTQLLLDHIKKGAPARIVCVSSMGHQWGELDVDDLNLEKRGSFGPDNFGAYANSKLANMYLVRSLAKKVKDDNVDNVTTYALCPGHVATELNRTLPAFKRFIARIMDKLFATTPAEGATTILYCALSKACASESGLMYRHNTIWKDAMEVATNDEVADKLWEKSEELVGLKK